MNALIIAIGMLFALELLLWGGNGERALLRLPAADPRGRKADDQGRAGRPNGQISLP